MIQHATTRPTAALVPFARNPKKHPPKQVDQIAASIREWGFTIPILIDEQNGIIAGHGRLQAAQKLGLADVPVLVATGWTAAQKRAYVLADNKLTENAQWDDDLLRVELAELKDLDFELDLTGFSDAEINKLLRDNTPLEEDAVPDVPENPVTVLGDLWTLGRHRLVCGDSTDAATVARCLDGKKPALMVTDPPYGVSYDPEWRKEAGVNNSERMGKVQNDDRADWTAAWKLFPGAVAYVWHAGKHAGVVAANLDAASFEIRVQLIWAKSRFALSRGNYHWQHEPCWYAVRKGQKSGWIGDRSQSTLWEIPVTDDGDKNKHGTQKPLECMGRPMRNHEAEEVYDPFLGSGSTLIAAEGLGKTVYGLELDPGYCDVIVQRWENRTGEKAVRYPSGAG